jgi:type II secretory ATPase GspE/PulE/Tfp pilus assembly ATPase PilB-like protein
MKVESFLLPVSLNLMISQRLVGLLCDNCKVAEAPSKTLQDVIVKTLAELPEGTAQPSSPLRIYHAPGCSVCKGRGSTGRIALFEILKMTKELQEAMESGQGNQAIIRESKRQGMITLRQDGVLKALQGLVSMEEVLRTTDEGF